MMKNVILKDGEFKQANEPGNFKSMEWEEFECGVGYKLNQPSEPNMLKCRVKTKELGDVTVKLIGKDCELIKNRLDNYSHFTSAEMNLIAHTIVESVKQQQNPSLLRGLFGHGSTESLSEKDNQVEMNPIREGCQIGHGKGGN